MKRFNPFVQAWKKAILSPYEYKRHSLLVLSAPLAFVSQQFINSVVQISNWYVHGSFLGISVSFISVLVALMVGDFFTGVSASKHEGESLKSQKVAYTFYKFLMYFAFFVIINETHKMLVYGGVWGWLGFVMTEGTHLISFVRTFIFIILIFREFISIGENLKRRFGKRPYIFTLTEKLVDLVEDNFIKKFSEMISNAKKNEPSDQKPTGEDRGAE